MRHHSHTGHQPPRLPLGKYRPGTNTTLGIHDPSIPDWDLIIPQYLDGGAWGSWLGPPPGSVGCRVPDEYLDHYDLPTTPRSPSTNGRAVGEGRKPAGEAEAAKSSSSKTSEGDKFKNWPDPCPLPASLLPVDAFKYDLLPNSLRPWIADVSARMQCPPDFAATTVMAGLGSVIGRKVLIRPQANNDWEVCANMWAVNIGRPGVLKSPAMQEALRPLKKLSARALEAFEQVHLEYEVAAKVLKLRTDEKLREATKLLKDNAKADIKHLLLNQGDVQEPTLRRYIANDTNVASLGVLLQQNPNGLLVFRDELVSLLDSLDQEESASERGFYLTGWNGDSSYTFDRIGRGLHLHIEAVCLSMVGSTQPGRISQYLSRAVRGGRGDDGLIQRFGLLAWPDVSGEWTHVDRLPDREARTAAFGIFEKLDALDWHAIRAQRDRGPDGDEEGSPYLRFGIDAHDRFVEWWSDLEKRLRGDGLHPALESHLAKYRKLVPGLALICYLADGGTGPVGVAAVERAIGWARYLETHACRAYGSVTAASASTAQAIVAKIRASDLKSEFSSRDVWRPGWSKLTDRGAVQGGLDMLVDYDWLATRKVETGGRPALVYVVNPKIILKV